MVLIDTSPLTPQEELARRQGNMAEQISALEQMEQQHAAEASLRWEQMLHRAEQMDERQAHYAALQEALAASSGLLLQQSGQLHGAIQTVLMAQERTSSLLGRVLGGHWTLKVVWEMVRLFRGLLWLDCYMCR